MKNKLIILVFVLLLITMPANISSQSMEYLVKASLIEKFTRYIEWESNTIGEFFIIDVLGKSPFDGELEKMAKKFLIKNKPVKINYINDFHEVKKCQLCFVCLSEKQKLREITKYLGDRNTLLVSDSPGFSELGIHINFYFKDDKTIHFELNLKALAKSKLRPDMQLINISKIIN